MAQDLYTELVAVPFMSKFIVFARRDDPSSARLRLFCMTKNGLWGSGARWRHLVNRTATVLYD